jgi:hypothetical protein
MPSTISAGTTAGTAIAVAGDTTGNLAFQTNGTTTAMTITTAQRVGIGTSSPGAKLDIASAELTGIQMRYDTTTTYRAQIIPYWNTFSDTKIDLLINRSPGVDPTVVLSANAGGNLQFNSGYGSVATAYGCRAWVNFNGTGTPAIRASGNVTSITDNNTGNYTINFTTAMPDVNYSVNTTINLAVAQTLGVISGPYTFNTSSVDITVRNTEDNASVDPTTLSAVIFR